LALQVDTEYPTRSKGTDGTVASKIHDKTSPNSDHRPHPFTGSGVVRGIDVTVTPEQGREITEALRLSRDPRIKYVIFDGRSFWSVVRNGVPAWEWRPYLGANPHEKHFHLSTNPTRDNDSGPWALKLGDDLAFTSEQEQFLKDFHQVVVNQMRSNATFAAEVIELLRANVGVGPFATKEDLADSGLKRGDTVTLT
jgi:hypothetical protein